MSVRVQDYEISLTVYNENFDIGKFPLEKVDGKNFKHN